MILYKDKFEFEHNDHIAVIYELDDRHSYDGYCNIENKAIHKNPICNAYFLNPHQKYLIICGQSVWTVEGNEITNSYIKKGSSVIL